MILPRDDATLAALRARTDVGLARLLGLTVEDLQPQRARMRLAVRPELLAPNGYLHAASVIALADTCCGLACSAHLPNGAHSFTTIELKANFLGTATAGTLEAEATAVHLGRLTQVWDAQVRHLDSGKTIAVFRCTQMVLWPTPAAAPAGN